MFLFFYSLNIRCFYCFIRKIRSILIRNKKGIIENVKVASEDFILFYAHKLRAVNLSNLVNKTSYGCKFIFHFV